MQTTVKELGEALENSEVAFRLADPQKIKPDAQTEEK